MVTIDPRYESAADSVRGRLAKQYFAPRRSLLARLKRGCCLLWVFGLIAVVLILAAALAKAGIVNIPVFSDWFYRFPQPIRTVEVDSDSTGGGHNGLPFVLSADAQRLEISEEQLTVLLRQLLATGAEPYFAPTVQAVITPEGIEVFGLLLRPLKVNVTVQALPTLVDDELHLAARHVQVGNLDLPGGALDWLVGSLVGSLAVDLDQLISQVGPIADFQLTDGTLVFNIKND